MRVLLDTHALIWALIAPERLSPRIFRLLSDRKTLILVSSATIWELGIKYHSGKIPQMARFFPRIDYHLARLGTTALPIDREHAFRAAALPLLHKDPFDRMLVAQALAEGVPVVTNDAMLARYDVLTIW